ncbi:MAG: FAD-dependent oxidoreductase [Planctomycetota bacterium]|nr:FAD-dependent oxidoreductase [Planctomycetota bacterium]MEC8652962.1 FAD-dependent oxidoreductase [Planctomycetota bacterium]MEC9047426.1 FAD-dependent oxidoreductase [Planctomycetota bacterium]
MTARVLDADVGVVGAGPGGMAAATRLAAAGLRVTVLDEGARAGGQIYRQLPEGAGAGGIPEPPSHDHGHHLIEGFESAELSCVHGATVWDAKPGRLWFEHAGESKLLRCERIVLAPGAYDRCIPFPGWTLPGVVTAGALQVMVRGFGVVPGKRALVVGSGPLLLPTVTALLGAGVEVVAALEASSRWRALRAAPGVVGNAARRREAVWYMKQLWRHGVKLQWGWTVFACEGDGRVQRAVIGKVDGQGRPRRGTERTVEVDVVGAGFGLVPSLELGLRLGADSRYLAERGGHCLVVDERQQAAPGVFAAGEICGIGGAEVAAAEGALCAASVLEEVRGAAAAPDLARSARAERRAADTMLRAFAPLPGLSELARPDTVVCRCEDITRLQAQQAAAVHGDTMRAIKLGCRAGMGPCQARICGPSLQAVATGDGARVMDRPVVQVPLKPVRACTILEAPSGD